MHRHTQFTTTMCIYTQLKHAFCNMVRKSDVHSDTKLTKTNHKMKPGLCNEDWISMLILFKSHQQTDF